MVYVMRCSAPAPGGEVSRMLHEMTAKAARDAVEGRHDQARYGIRFERVSAAQAHRWVREGNPHATALWIDDNKRVRRGE